MLPADGILRAALRWLTLLDRSTFTQAVALIKSDPRYADHTQTQYSNALDWLLEVGLVVQTSTGLAAAEALQGASQSIYRAALVQASPAWLADSDALIQDADSLPLDAATLASALELPDSDALLAIRQVHGHIDLAERSRVGAAGERALVRLLESCWPGSTNHVALDHDGFGFDVQLTLASRQWHLEVKSTTRHGRLTIHLSRHELEVARLDPAWRLVIVGLDTQDRVAGLASASFDKLMNRAPKDQHNAARWESSRYELAPTDLTVGFQFLGQGDQQAIIRVLSRNAVAPFAWMPT